MSTTAPPRAHPPSRRPLRQNPPSKRSPKTDVVGMNFCYGDRRVLEQITVKVRPNAPR